MAFLQKKKKKTLFLKDMKQYQWQEIKRKWKI